ncbi:MAG: gluconate 2-dehydrogenase subunit 3 family protein [Pseudomonadota bacterium]
MRLIEKRVRLTRRGFLKGSGMASLGMSVMSAGTLLAAPGAALAQSFTVLGSDAGVALLRMARDIFPHDRLADKYYLRAIESHDADAAKDPALKALLLDGVAQLNARARQRHGQDYAGVPEEAQRVLLLQEIESSAFFQKIRGALVTGIYNNAAVFPLFGYEGSSWEKGGYVNRGFNDIDWV